jgi:asparagine synthase (glutamine-hydrolysing)
MSGICGVVSLDGRPFSAADLGGVRQNLRPLGESEGSWEGEVGRCGVALGATVSQWTPEDAFEQQPFWTAGGMLGIVSDMRIDNRAELIAQLGLRSASELPDSAVALAAYERWGKGFLNRMVGSFALAIVDRQRGGVLLARDHRGDRPLVVHERRGVVLFASNALALTAFDGVGHGLDMRWATEVLGLTYDTALTPVHGVRWLARATGAWIDAGGLREWRWWDPDPLDFDVLDQPEHEHLLRASLEVAVSSMLRSSGEVCTGVSGGLDSTSVTATAARILQGAPLRTYTIAPPLTWDGPDEPGWDGDESPLVADLAEMHPNIDPVIVRKTDPAQIFTLHEGLWEVGGEPLYDPCNGLGIKEMIERAAGDGFKVQLGGDLGNLFFSADGPQWLAALMRRGRILELARESLHWRRASGQGLAITLRRELLPELLGPKVYASLRKLRGRPSPALNRLSMTALRRELTAGLPISEDQPRRDRRQLALDTLDHHAGQADTFAAMHAVWRLDRREPTADRRVMEVAIRQPEWARRRRGVNRAVARGAMGDRLPPSIRQRTRRGAQLPDWLIQISTQKARIEGELDAASEDPVSEELIDIERLRRLVRNWPKRSAAADNSVICNYRTALMRTLLVSKYLRWFAARAQRKASESRRRAEMAESLPYDL